MNRISTEGKLQQLRDRLLEIEDLKAAAEVLYWDQATYMPPGGAVTRGRHLATLRRLAHEKFVDPAIGRLLEDLQPYAEGLPADSVDASLVRVVRRDYEKAIRVPASFVEEMENHASAAYEAWVQARPADDFSLVQPYVEKTIELSRRLAGFFPGYEHIADPLIDDEDPGMTVSVLRDLFGRLREALVPLVQRIAAQPSPDDALLHQYFPDAQQWDVTLEVARVLGYDFERGRQDRTPHPFTSGFGRGDVRITTRVDEHDFTDALFGTIHEAGHALYEQGIRPELEGTPLAVGVSAGVHESQSRLWENLVGRSRAFWQFLYPRLQVVFPDQLGGVRLEDFYRAINKVQPSLIRTSSDEVTYNLHIIVRFELELELLEGRLMARDLPEVWRQRYQSDLGITPPNDRDGVLQDAHWYDGVIGGGFQGYTLGNVLSTQFYEAAQRAHPDIPAEIAQGEFGTLRRWLTDNIYQHGRIYDAPDLVERVTGKPLGIESYLHYLQNKYGELYTL